jgi:PadR family transcriptional regulator, regulatory protein PadR
MGERMNLTYPTALILQALANGYRYGFDIMDVTGLPSGTVYPALRRMERVGFVVSKWEDAEIAQREQRPTRRYYEVTASGLESLAAAARRFRLLENLMPGQPGARRPSEG